MPRKKLPYVPKPGFSAADVLALTDASKSNLVHWTNTGIIKAAVTDTTGPGHRRRYSPLNVIQAQLATTVNGWGVPAETIRAAMNIFLHFHYGAVAMHEYHSEAQLITNPPHLALFPTSEARRLTALRFMLGRHPQRIGEDEEQERVRLDASHEDAVKMANVWAHIRSGPLNRGAADLSAMNTSHFLGLFIQREAGFADVALNPSARDLSNLMGDTAIVIDLAAVVFRVGEHCARLGSPGQPFPLGAW